jgi:hypothetical protein
MKRILAPLAMLSGALIIWYAWLVHAECREPGYVAQMARTHLPAQMARHPKAQQLWMTRPDQRRQIRTLMRWIPLPPGYSATYYREIWRFVRHRARLADFAPPELAP